LAARVPIADLDRLDLATLYQPPDMNAAHVRDLSRFAN
jgi:hypothetical protein